MSQLQPDPYYPPQPQSHNHDKFIAAVIVGVVASAIVAGSIGYGLGYGVGSLGKTSGTSPIPQGMQFTYLHGTINIYPHSGTAFGVYFDNQNTGTLSAVAGGQDAKYQLYLPTGNTYQVTIYYYNQLSGTQSCTARPSPLVPTGSDHTQDFSC